MNVKKYIYLILAMTGCIFLFTGCIRHIPITINCKNLPADSKMFVLLRPVEEKTQPLYIPDEIKGTELEGYKRDGLVPAAYVDSVYESQTDNGKITEISYENASSTGDIRAFCQKYQEIRFAVMDKNGKILYITSTLDLTPSDRFGYPENVTYDAQTDIFTTDLIVDKLILGLSPLEWWLLVTVCSWPTAIMLLVIIIMTIKKPDKNPLREVRIPVILFSLPSVAGIIMGMVFNFLPFFDGNYKLSNILQTLGALIVLNIIFIAAMILLMISIKRNKQKNT